MKPMVRARPLSEWTEEDGDVLWWKFPIVEPPYVGSPLALGKTIALQIVGADEPFLGCKFDVGAWPGYHTHWTPIPVPRKPRKARRPPRPALDLSPLT